MSSMGSMDGIGYSDGKVMIYCEYGNARSLASAVAEDVDSWSTETRRLIATELRQIADSLEPPLPPPRYDQEYWDAIAVMDKEMTG